MSCNMCIRKANQAPYIVKGYRLWDKVAYNGTECFITGRRTSGYFALKELDGTVVSNSISYKKLRLLEAATNYITERLTIKSQAPKQNFREKF